MPQKPQGPHEGWTQPHGEKGAGRDRREREPSRGRTRAVLTERVVRGLSLEPTAPGPSSPRPPTRSPGQVVACFLFLCVFSPGPRAWLDPRKKPFKLSGGPAPGLSSSGSPLTSSKRWT